jgi:hypothetical protein
MTKQEYLFIKLFSNGDWFDWVHVNYTTDQFHTWRMQGFMVRMADLPVDEQPMGVRVTHWKLTPQAHNLLGKQDD